MIENDTYNSTPEIITSIITLIMLCFLCMFHIILGMKIAMSLHLEYWAHVKHHSIFALQFPHTKVYVTSNDLQPSVMTNNLDSQVP